MRVDGNASAALRHELGPALADLVSHPTGDDLDRYVRSVRLERVAASPTTETADTTVSVVLATRRPDMLDRTVDMLRRQRGVEVELIVGLHGSHWPDTAEARLRSTWDGPLQTARRDEAVPLGTLLNQLVALAGGRFVSKWDDDDWYGDDHLGDLLRARHASGASLVGKAAEFVYLDAADVTVRRPASGARTFTDNLAGGTLLIATDELRALGGFPDAPRSVDRGLIETASSAGAAVYRTHGLGFVLRRSTAGSHTWDVAEAYFRADAIASRPGLDLAFADIVDASEDGRAT